MIYLIFRPPLNFSPPSQRNKKELKSKTQAKGDDDDDDDDADGDSDVSG